ncbi:hypothetical protein LINPERHAP2_LOCUS218 [Linum perenne]
MIITSQLLNGLPPSMKKI